MGSAGHQVWLTGASGFLGSRILTELVKRNREQVIAISRRPTAFVSEAVEWVSPNFTPRLAATSRVSIIHAATDYGWSEDPERSTIDANLSLPLSLIRRAGANLESFIALDSFYNKIDRHYPYLKQYSRSKRMLIQWLKEDNPNYSISRIYLEHLYGPGDSSKKFVPWLLSELIAGRDVPLTLGGQVRDFTYVDDAARAVLEIWSSSMVKGQGYVEFEVGSGHGTSIREFAELAKHVLDSRSRLLFGRANERAGEIAASVAQTSTSQDLRCAPEIDLREGIIRTSHWLRTEIGRKVRG